VAATNRDLRAMLAKGQFRDDLYWRVNVITLELPPLRERREDLPLLVRHFLDSFAVELGKERFRLDAAAEAALAAYAYPGNIRELENILRRAAILVRGPRITVADLPPRLLGPSAESPPIPTTTADLKAAKATAAAAASREVERRFLTDLLTTTTGNVTEAARRVGMNRSWLHQLLARHRLDPKSFHPSAPDR
jgi:DNA-binding NtrC family response regulator